MAGRRGFKVIALEEFDAPAGTYVLIPDPVSHRHASANEPGTTVLSFGGPPTFTPSSWEWRFRARPLMGSDPDQAREIIEDGLRTYPDDPGLIALRDSLRPPSAA